MKDGCSQEKWLNSSTAACLPNHVVGKGMIKALKKRNPYANVAAIDYDPGASSVNQLNRIKLMMATAHKNLEKKQSQ